MKFFTTILALTLLTACVSNRAVQTVQPDDYAKSCETLQFELQQLGATFEESKD